MYVPMCLRVLQIVRGRKWNEGTYLFQGLSLCCTNLTDAWAQNPCGALIRVFAAPLLILDSCRKKNLPL